MVADPEEGVVTGLMIGSYVVLGADAVALVGVLWLVGQAPFAAFTAVAAAVHAVYAGWAGYRWRALRARDDGEPDPLEAVKRRYARGELTEAEFERRVEALVGTDERAGPGSELAPDPDSGSSPASGTEAGTDHASGADASADGDGDDRLDADPAGPGRDRREG